MPEPKSLFAKLKRGLFMTHTEIIEKVKEAMVPDLPIDKRAIDGLEEGLLGADIGAELTMALIDRIESRVRDERITSMDRLTEVLRDETRALIPQRQASSIDSATSQFFINLADNASLDFAGYEPDQYGYCVFGEVVEGMDVVEQIARLDIADNGGVFGMLPKRLVVIQSAERVSRAH